MLLVECRRAFQGEPIEFDDEPSPNASAQTPAAAATAAGAAVSSQGLDAEWEERLSAARVSADEAAERRMAIDPSRLADGLLACGQFLDSTAAQPAEVDRRRAVEARSRGALRCGSRSFISRTTRAWAARIAKLTAVAEREAVVVLRERAHDLPPTWKDTLAKRSALLATGRARWIWFEREDAERLLALDSLLQAARSGDLTDTRGAPISAASVSEWVAAKLEIPKWTIVRDVLGEGEEEGARAGSGSAE